MDILRATRRLRGLTQADVAASHLQKPTSAAVRLPHAGLSNA